MTTAPTIRLLLLMLLVAGCPLRPRKPAPLVLHQGRYSYTFDVPAGWEFSFEEEDRLGVPLVFFPKGGSVSDSNTIVYVNETCSTNCSGAFDSIVQTSLERARRDSPDLQVRSAPSIPMTAGGRAEIRVLSGTSDPRRVREALAFIRHDETIVLVVLTTKDVGSWDTDYEAFAAIVRGHRFFNCDSPGLAVPCRKPPAEGRP
jgi:hypothetical protein